MLDERIAEHRRAQRLAGEHHLLLLLQVGLVAELELQVVLVLVLRQLLVRLLQDKVAILDIWRAEPVRLRTLAGPAAGPDELRRAAHHLGARRVERRIGRRGGPAKDALAAHVAIAKLARRPI